MKLRYNKMSSFKRLLPLSILLLGVLVFSSCTAGGSVPRGWSSGTIADGTLFIGSMEGKVVALKASDGSRIWEASLETQGSTTGGFGCASAPIMVPIYGSPAVAGDLVYVGGYDGIVYAFSSNNGALRWVYPRRDHLDPIVGEPVVAQNRVYFGSSGGKIYALDAETGNLVWEFKTGGKIWSTPAIDGSTLFIGSFDKKLYAIDTTTGKEKWEKPFETEGAIVSTPLVYNNKVYIGSFDQHFYAVDATDGQQIWKFPSDNGTKDKPENWFWARPVIYDNTIYAPNLDGKVYVLNAETGGEVVDAIDLGGLISSSPVVTGTLLIVATEDGAVYAFDTNTKQEKWKNDALEIEKQKIYASLTTEQGVVYVHTSKGELHALNVESGAKLWSLSLKS